MESERYLKKLISLAKFMERLDTVPANVNLSQTEFRLLREIVVEREAGKQIISSELARRLNLTRSAISQIVTKLEERGIVKRTPSSTDRKIFYVVLTESSILELKRQCNEATAFFKKVVGEFGKEKADLLIGLCEEFASVFEKVRGETKKGK